MPKIKKAITPRLAAVASAAAASVPMNPAQAKAALEPPVPAASAFKAGDWVTAYGKVYQIEAVEAHLAVLAGYGRVALAHLRPAKAPEAAPVPNGRTGKVKRTVRVEWTNGPFSVLVIRQETRPGSDVWEGWEYLCERLGQGFWLLTKLDPTEQTRYTVFLGEECSCSCKGFKGHGHCKHTAAVDTLVAQGKLVP